MNSPCRVVVIFKGALLHRTFCSIAVMLFYNSCLINRRDSFCLKLLMTQATIKFFVMKAKANTWSQDRVPFVQHIEVVALEQRA